MSDRSLVNLFILKSVHAVNDICFHPKEPWMLLGHSHGIVSIWSYITCNQLLHLEAHDGAVQSVDFNSTCSLFVSGGCDGKIKLWDYDEIGIVKNTFELEGHNASVNDVKFHHEFPWLVSASDDCTVRLWNWLSRSCIAVLSEHLGAVTSATFHPREYIVLSTSMDGKLRIWDMGGINDAAFSRVEHICKRRRWRRFFGFFNKLSKKNYGLRLKNVLKGHKSGVVSAIFHPTLPFIFSASDDGDVYWWKVGETSGEFEHQPLHLQTKVVSRLAYSKMLKAVASTPDGENISLFDVSSRSRNKGTLRTSQKNMFCLATHPTKRVVAIGHSKGMSFHRVMCPPPAFSVINNLLYFVKDKSLLLYDYSTNKDAHVILGPMDDLPIPGIWPIVLNLSCSPDGNAALISFDSKRYRLVLLNPSNCKNNKGCSIIAEGDGMSAVFVSPDRFVVHIRCGTAMTKVNVLSVRTLGDEIVSESVMPCDIDSISSYVGLGNHLLCKARDRVVMFDVQQSMVVAELSVSLVRYIFWATYRGTPVVALVGECLITMADSNLLHMCTIDHGTLIESGAWDDENEGVFIYKTPQYIKYCLINGKSGTVMRFNEPLCITRVSGNTAYCLEEGGKVCQIALDATEYALESSILNKDYMKQCCMGLC